MSEVRLPSIDKWFRSESGEIDNMRRISLSRAEAVKIDPAHIQRYLLSAAARAQKALSAQSDAPWTFYVWHDEMVGQLCFSAAPVQKVNLPFGTKVRLIDELFDLVTEFLESSYLDGIPMSECKVIANEKIDDDFSGQLEIRVWARELS